MPRQQPVLERLMVDAFETLPILERLEYVKALLFNSGGDPKNSGDPNNPDCDPLRAVAVQILDGIIEDVESDPDVARFPRINPPPGPTY